MRDRKRKDRKMLHCKRCGYDWFPRKGVPPALCPRCRNRYWDKPVTFPNRGPKRTVRYEN